MYLLQKFFSLKNDWYSVFLREHQFEIIIGGKLYRFVSSYHSTNQSQDVFESFANNFKLNNDAITTLWLQQITFF